MNIKIVTVMITVGIIEITRQVRSEEFLSPVLKKNRTDLNRFSFGEKQYYIGSVFTANFYKAMQFCRQQNMHLLSINSKIENDRIGKYLLDNGFGGHFWTSASSHGDGSWIWLSTGREMTYTNWYPGEPSGKSTTNQTENCVEVRHWGSLGFTWNDLRCDLNAYFICESAQC